MVVSFFKKKLYMFEYGCDIYVLSFTKNLPPMINRGPNDAWKGIYYFK